MSITLLLLQKTTSDASSLLDMRQYSFSLFINIVDKPGDGNSDDVHAF